MNPGYLEVDWASSTACFDRREEAASEGPEALQ